ncbi:prephenate dehydratase [Pseudogracilibacillus auburnensis]|uniref:prephenate dehydratase n=1 Tax=Pseudogracilibacillus auburnensis TaxID=1494959 RepID=UPI001A96AC65|nr:prephenate dehydratase [Pseudogracilibacillus auburnensis]MBO1003405.1 prephenate dehydratase [Pseudogracilibacillus auburnensis]
MSVKIGYLGPKGTFTKLAVDAAFNGDDKISFKTIPQCIDAVNNEKVHIGVVPIENAIEGTVHLSIDYLVHQVRLPIIAEIVVPIQQNLLVHRDFAGELLDIKEVHSHRHAIAQCQQYIHKFLPQATIHYTNSTGSAAEMVSANGNPIAAIGNTLAAEEYNLNIMEENIHDYPNNHTRFIVLAKNKELVKINHSTDLERTSLLITLPEDRAGVLHQVLSAFAWRKMNLSKIESRPMKTGLGNYFFIIDVDEPYDDALFPGVQGELEALGCKVTILGTYPVYKLACK